MPKPKKAVKRGADKPKKDTSPGSVRRNGRSNMQIVDEMVSGRSKDDDQKANFWN